MYREQCNVCKKLKAVFLDAFSACHCCVGALQWNVHSPKVGRHTGTRPQHATMAPSNSTTSTPPKVGRHPPPTIAHYNGTLQWHPAMAPRPLPQSWPSPSPNHSTLQWHPAMAPRPLPQSWPSPSPNQHTTMAPSNGTTSTPPKLVVTFPPNHSTLQWHPTMAPSNSTTFPPPKVGRHLSPTIAHYNGTLRWHPAMAPRPLP